MIRSKYALVAETAIRDAETNNVSVIALLEQMQPAGFPFVLPMLTLVWALERDPEDPPTVSAEFLFFLNEVQIHSFRMDLDFQNSMRARALLRIGGLVLAGPGLFKVSFRREGTEMAFYTIEITGHRTITERATTSPSPSPEPAS